jgi:hypothetical protein
MKTPSEPVCAGSYFGCLDPNQIGDVVAGVVAPLAFFWLVAAVLLQSQEFHDQREAANEQTKALKVQIDNMKKQTDVLDRQLKTFCNTEVKLLIDQLHLRTVRADQR